MTEVPKAVETLFKEARKEEAAVRIEIASLEGQLTTARKSLSEIRELLDYLGGLRDATE